MAAEAGPVLKKDDEEHPVPEFWRAKFRQIAAAFAAGDFRLLDHSVEGVAPVEPEIAEDISANVLAYGETLASLDDATWDRSIYRWMDGHWLMLVDLTTESEAVSDLALHATLSDSDASLLEIQSVHVP